MSKVFVRVLGQGETLVLIHGWAMHSGVWGEFAQRLAERYRVVCVDLPGHGQSESLSEFTLEAISDTLKRIVGTEACYWLGWSLGGSVVLDFAQRYAQNVKGIILLASNPYFHCPIEDKTWCGVESKVLTGFAERLQSNAQATLLKFLSLQIMGLANYKTLLAELKQNVLTQPIPDYQTLQQGLLLLQESDLRPVLANLNLPVLVILGEKDHLIPVSVGELMQTLLPSLQLHNIQQAGHVPFLSHPLLLVELINEFIK